MTFKHIHRQIGCILLAGGIFLGMMACGFGEKNEQETPKGGRLTGELIPIASYRELTFNIANLPAYALMGEKLVYLENVWDENAGKVNSAVYRTNQDKTDVPEKVYRGISQEHSICSFISGQNDCLYFLERQWLSDGSSNYYLRKTDSEFQELYLTAFDPESPSDAPLAPAGMYESGNGSLIYLDYNGFAYFFDPQGLYLGHDTLESPSSTLVDGGETGVFLVSRNTQPAVFSAGYLFQRADLERGTLFQAESRDLSGIKGESAGEISIISGYDKGILISTETGLFSYDYAAGEYQKIFDWQSDTVNVDGSCVQGVRFLQEDLPLEWLGGHSGPGDTKGTPVEPGIPADLPAAWEAYSFDFRNGKSEFIQISYLDRGYLPDKQTVTLGVSFPLSGLYDRVRSFNRTHLDYQVELKEYDTPQEFAEDLILNHSDIPDVLDISWLNKDMLTGKNLLEDLTPYFTENETVAQSDILEPVWAACEEEGIVDSIIPAFCINSLITSAQSLPAGEGWTYDQFFELAETYPDSFLISPYTKGSVWYLLFSTLDSYVNWEERKCRFDSPEFIDLLNRVNSLRYPENQDPQYTFDLEEETRKLINQEFLLYIQRYDSPPSYNMVHNLCGSQAWDVGYPTKNGEPCYLLVPAMQLSIYADSPVRDGAWEFIEFVLSEEEQSWYSSEFAYFPVRKDAFEAYLNKPTNPLYFTPKDVFSADTGAALREMMNHMQREQNLSGSQISVIFSEEVAAFFAGDKTAEQCADMIQNRVQLYLDENY